MGDRETEALDAFLAEGKRLVEDALDQVIPPLGTPPPVLHQAIRYTLLLPGRRIRGIVVLAASDLLKGSREAALPLACAVEMVRASSLIVGDLPAMGDAEARGGKPALHRAVGEANAILAAVGLLAAAFATIQEAEKLSARARREATLRLARGIGADGLVGGQMGSLEGIGKRLDLETLASIHGHRTGALFAAAAEMGALAAGGRAKHLEVLGSYARNLGLAFQITDDLLDYSGSSVTPGDEAESGRDRERTTFVDLCGIDGARRLVDERIDAALVSLRGFGRRAGTLRALAEHVRGRDR